MSADNYIGVYQDGGQWVVCHGFATSLSEDPDYRGTFLLAKDTREEALAAAFDRYNKEAIVEYGVMELDPLWSPFTGRK